MESSRWQQSCSGWGGDVGGGVGREELGEGMLRDSLRTR